MLPSWLLPRAVHLLGGVTQTRADPGGHMHNTCLPCERAVELTVGRFSIGVVALPALDVRPRALGVGDDVT